MHRDFAAIPELDLHLEEPTTVEIPSYDQMLWPTLVAIVELNGSGSIQEVDDKAIELAGYSEDQQAVLHGDGPKTEIRYRMAWARSYLKAIGALENSLRGIWSVTDYGRSLAESDMAIIPAQVRHQWQKNRAARNSVPETPTFVDVEPATDDNQAAFTSTDPDEWRDALLDVLQNMTPGGFERLCQRVLRESGFTQVSVTGRSGDGGIDGLGVLRIALLSFQVFFQCKRYRGSVGASAIRDFRGAMWGRTDKGLLITTGTFTAEAKRESTRDGAPVLDLIDGDALCTILKNLQLGVETQLVEAVTINSGWFEGI
jgi:restriction system protein